MCVYVINSNYSQRMSYCRKFDATRFLFILTIAGIYLYALGDRTNSYYSNLLAEETLLICQEF